METTKRNRYVLEIQIELTHPIGQPMAHDAADLAAHDISEWLRSVEWGYGRARVQAVYAPVSQFQVDDHV